MTAWDPQNPPLILPAPPNQKTPGMGGYPTQGLWEPVGEGNPLLWKLVDLLTGGTERSVKKGSRRNIVDRRGGRIPLDSSRYSHHLDLQDFARIAASNRSLSDKLTSLGVLVRWLDRAPKNRRVPEADLP